MSLESQRSMHTPLQIIEKSGPLSRLIENVDDIIEKLEKHDSHGALHDLRALRPAFSEVFKTADKYPQEIMRNYSDRTFLRKQIAELSLELAEIKEDADLSSCWQAKLSEIEKDLDINVITPTIEDLCH